LSDGDSPSIPYFPLLAARKDAIHISTEAGFAK